MDNEGQRLTNDLARAMRNEAARLHLWASSFAIDQLDDALSHTDSTGEKVYEHIVEIGKLILRGTYHKRGSCQKLRRRF